MGDKSICRQYAQNCLAAQKNKEKLLNNKAKIQDVQFSIDNMFAQVKMSQAMGDVTGIIQKVNGIMNIAEIGKVAASLQTNLAKMGIVGEMVEDAMEDVGMEDDIDDPQVDGLLDEIEGKYDINKGTTKLKAQEEQQEQTDNFDD